MTKKYAKKLKGLVSEFEEKVEALAEEYRQTVLIPLCKKHSLCFLSGMGTFYFYPAKDFGKFGSDWNASNFDDCVIEEKMFLAPYLETLNEEVTHGQYFGYYVEDIVPGDY